MRRVGCPPDSGCPIRESRDQRLFGSYSGLIAAYYALHRLPAPRHPPCALGNLTTIVPAPSGASGLAAVRPCGTGTPPARRRLRARAAVRSRLRSPTPSPRRRDGGGDIAYTLCRYSFVKEPAQSLADCGLGISDRADRAAARQPLGPKSTTRNPQRPLVEPMGFEPTASWLQTRRSPG